MRIAICSIAKNEAKFVERWAESARDADLILLADTGSTDDTCGEAMCHTASVYDVHISPWRFDHARNAALALLPADIDVVITLDLDEVLVPGWREVIESAWVPGTTRLRYNYVWNWNGGEPGVQFLADRIYARNGYQWKGPVHEVILPCVGTVENVAFTDKTLIHHHADDTKSRGSYLPLLELAVAENPQDDRAAHYLGREYLNYNRPDDAIRELTRHLSLPTATWDEERAASMRFIARAHIGKGEYGEAARWYLKAIAECGSRECWYEWALFCQQRGDYAGGYAGCIKALTLTIKSRHYLIDQYAWGAGPYDVGAVCAWNMGMRDVAVKFATKALELNPTDERLKKNLEMMA